MTFRNYLFILMLPCTVANAGAESLPASDVAQSDEEIYNEGVLLYREQQWNDAAERFRRSSQSGTQALAAKSRYNLGNCFYADALQQAQAGAGTQAVTPFVRDAIASYRSALRLNPSDDDARANLELAVRALDELNQPDNQAPEQPPQEDQERSEQDQQEQDEQDQEEKGQTPEQQDSQEQQESSETEESTKSESDAGQDRESESDESSGESQADQTPEESGEPKTSKDSQDDPSGDEQRPSANQPNDQESKSQGDDSAGMPDDLDPTGTENAKTDSRGKLEASDQPSDGTDPTGMTEAEQTEVDGGQLMTEQEAMKMLQAIRDRDLLRRYQHERAERSRYVPVDRDW